MSTYHDPVDSRLSHELQDEDRHANQDRFREPSPEQLALDQRLFAEESQDVFLNMIRDGGSFVRHLGELGVHADTESRRRIKASWPELWREYARGKLCFCRIHDKGGRTIAVLHAACNLRSPCAGALAARQAVLPKEHC